MSNIIIETAQKDYNHQIVTINFKAIEESSFDKKYTYFFFTPQAKIPISDLKKNLQFILAFNSINYQYWFFNESKQVERYEHNNFIGYSAIYKGFSNFFNFIHKRNNSIDLIQEKDITNYFGNIPDKKGRMECLKDCLNEHRFEKFLNLIKEEAKSGIINIETAQKIAELFPKSFQDPYLRKIQLALYEMSELLKIEYPKLKTDFTVASEYQLPKVLKAMGILQYSKNLEETISNTKHILQDSPEELAIRAATILACEEICKIHGMLPEYLDKILWDYRRNFGNIKFHLTVTKRY